MPFPVRNVARKQGVKVFPPCWILLKVSNQPASCRVAEIAWLQEVSVECCILGKQHCWYILNTPQGLSGREDKEDNGEALLQGDSQRRYDTPVGRCFQAVFCPLISWIRFSFNFFSLTRSFLLCPWRSGQRSPFYEGFSPENFSWRPQS